MIIVACVGILAGLGGIAILSRKEQGDLFTRMSSFVYKQLCVQGMLRSTQVESDLERLYPGVSARELQMDYYIAKIRLVILVVLVGSMLTFLLGVKNQLERGRELQEIQRAETGMGGEEYLLTATIGGEREEVMVYVEERMLMEEEIQVLFEACVKELEAVILGDNKDLEHITKDLSLVDSLEGYPFEIVWKSSEPLLISSVGELKEVSGRNGEEICLTATLSYGEFALKQDFLVALGQVEKTYDLQEKLYRRVQEQDKVSRYEAVLPLPHELEGEKIHWKYAQEGNGVLFLGLTIFAAGSVFLLKDKDLHGQVLERKRYMKMAYPAILNKYVLYMSAGMTVRGSFIKIAMDYQKKRKQEEKNPAYEEMLFSCHELSAGVSEGLVYERFGKRSGLQEYARFAGMLGQNLKKGNAALLGRLREEADKAMQENLQFRKKLGEEAETKLLVPMIMMMGIVMLLVMIPAFTSFT